MLDDGKPQARTAQLAASRGVGPVEPLEDTWQMLRLDAAAMISNADNRIAVEPFQRHLDPVSFEILGTRNQSPAVAGEPEELVVRPPDREGTQEPAGRV